MTPEEKLDKLLDEHFPGWRDDPSRALMWIDETLRRKDWAKRKRAELEDVETVAWEYEWKMKRAHEVISNTRNELVVLESWNVGAGMPPEKLIHLTRERLGMIIRKCEIPEGGDIPPLVR